MLLCRVIVGQPYLAKTDMRGAKHPPIDPAASQDGVANFYDSVVALTASEGGCVDHPEVIVFEKDRVLPMYLITYRHLAGCRCHTCVK